MTTTATDFITAIVANPDDVTLRLVYADYLEETGEGERAEFIRVQCELASLDPYHRSCTGDKCPGCSALRRRERELLWVATQLPPPGTRAADGWGMVVGRGTGDGWSRFHTVRCGFIEAVTCRLEDWIGIECPTCDGTGSVNTGPGDYGDEYIPCGHCHKTGRVNAHGIEIVRAAPITEVAVTYHQPWFAPPSRRFHWLMQASWHGNDGHPDQLPPIIFERLHGRLWGVRGSVKEYETRAKAEIDLSHAAIAWARQHAGLPKLEEVKA